jgi:hypothetical protein
VNYALSEVKNPARTIRIAGPLGLGVVAILYLLTNIAYFAGASKEEITSSGRLVAALLFKNVYGPQAERIMSGFVALSALGNVLSVVSTPRNPISIAFSIPLFSPFASDLRTRSCNPRTWSRRHSTIQQGLVIKPSFQRSPRRARPSYAIHFPILSFLPDSSLSSLFYKTGWLASSSSSL